MNQCLYIFVLYFRYYFWTSYSR